MKNNVPFFMIIVFNIGTVRGLPNSGRIIRIWETVRDTEMVKLWKSCAFKGIIIRHNQISNILHCF